MAAGGDRWLAVEKRVEEVFGAWKDARKEDDALPGLSMDRVYGEVRVGPWLDWLADAVRLWRGEGGGEGGKCEFVDMGCGRGVAVVAAALSGLVERSRGVELDVHWVETGRRVLEKVEGGGEVVEGDVRDGRWWKDVDGVVFVHGSTWTLELQRDVLKAAEEIKFGSLLAVVSWEVHSPLFALIDERAVDMDWGRATVRIYRRQRVGRWAGRLFARK
jgi:hypothetical protein